MRPYIHPRVAAMLELGDELQQLARELVRQARQRRDAKRPRIRRGSTLRPGTDTPLWNALVSMIQPHLKRRGHRAVLARELELHRARMGEFFDRQSAMPDAERTLLLLVWLSDRTAKATPAPTKPKVRKTNKRA